MKVYILSLLVSIAVAKPANEILAAPTAYVLGTPIQSQYHSQDYLGQYAYGYNSGLSAKAESRSLDGTVQGGYTYLDANGKLQSVSYIADDVNGFRVAATNLPKAVPLPEIKPLEAQQLIQPQPVAETPEVAAARSEHLKAVEAAKNRKIELLPAQPLLNEAPKPVEDTPEVAKAKAEHLAALKEAELRNANLLRIEVVQPAAAPQPLPLAALAPLPAEGLKLLPAPQQPIALLDPNTFTRSLLLPYGAANYGWSYGYSSLAPLGFDSRFFYVGKKY